jgi:uncharacterized protein (UPF0276 family)
MRTLSSSHTSAGLGLRRGLMPELLALQKGAVDFLELAPDNWIGVGGKFGEDLQELSQRFPLTAHGLSLSLGGVEPLDMDFLARTRAFNDRFGIALYSEHLSYSADDGHLYDLMPIPFTDEAIRHVGARIRQVQDVLGRRIAVENVSYYAAPFQALAEVDFINAVLAEADCDLLLDVNNLYVNSINHGYDAEDFLKRLPGERIASYHIAGHYDEADDLKVDTHGAPVKDAVWTLLVAAYRRFGVRPTLLERDFNFPPISELLLETGRIRTLQVAMADRHAAAGAGVCLRHCAISNSPCRAICAIPMRMHRPPGIEARRLKLYRELFFGAIEGLLANSFPVIRQTLGSTQWRTLVERFYASHRSRTPLFPELAGEFVEFVEARDLESGIPPWLPDLAHYEWVEQALSISDATPPAA